MKTVAGTARSMGTRRRRLGPRGQNEERRTKDEELGDASNQNAGMEHRTTPTQFFSSEFRRLVCFRSSFFVPDSSGRPKGPTNHSARNYENARQEHTRRLDSKSRTGLTRWMRRCRWSRRSSLAKFDADDRLSIRLGVDRSTPIRWCAAPSSFRTAWAIEARAGDRRRDKQKEAEEAGADLVAAEELVEKIAGGWLDFDGGRRHARHDARRRQAGKGAAAQRLTPNPKTGTVTPNVAQTVKEIVAGTVENRVDKTGIVHAPVGKLSFPAAEPDRERVGAARQHRPGEMQPAAKGKQSRAASLSRRWGLA